MLKVASLPCGKWDDNSEFSKAKMSIPTTLPGCLSLEEHDPVMFDLIEKEKFRQWSGI
jgi:hypothetical protein